MHNQLDRYNCASKKYLFITLNTMTTKFEYTNNNSKLYFIKFLIMKNKFFSTFQS